VSWAIFPLGLGTGGCRQRWRPRRMNRKIEGHHGRSHPPVLFLFLGGLEDGLIGEPDSIYQEGGGRGKERGLIGREIGLPVCLDSATALRRVSSASRLATSPAACPPMPSATAKKPRSGSAQKASSLFFSPGQGLKGLHSGSSRAPQLRSSEKPRLIVQSACSAGGWVKTKVLFPISTWSLF